MATLSQIFKANTKVTRIFLNTLLHSHWHNNLGNNKIVNVYICCLHGQIVELGLCEDGSVCSYYNHHNEEVLDAAHPMGMDDMLPFPIVHAIVEHSTRILQAQAQRLIEDATSNLDKIFDKVYDPRN